MIHVTNHFLSATLEGDYPVPAPDGYWDIFHDEVASRAVTRNLPKVLNAGQQSLELKFTSKEAFEDAKYQLIENDRIYYLISSANVLVKPGNKVSTTKLQYNTDDDHLIMRFFFVR